MSKATQGWVAEWLSPARLAPYVRASNGTDALGLYRWNCQLSCAMFELIGWFEVCWRNAVDNAIQTRRSTDQHWLFDPTFPLQPNSRDKVRRAAQAARRSGAAQPAPGQVIAELSLGFWRLTTKGYRTTIWAPYLSRAFPHAPRRPDQGTVDRLLVPIILTRNRIAHHEPIFADPKGLADQVADILRLGSWLNPSAARWWEENMSVREVLSRRP